MLLAIDEKGRFQLNLCACDDALEPSEASTRPHFRSRFSDLFIGLLFIHPEKEKKNGRKRFWKEEVLRYLIALQEHIQALPQDSHPWQENTTVVLHNAQETPDEEQRKLLERQHFRHRDQGAYSFQSFRPQR